MSKTLEKILEEKIYGGGTIEEQRKRYEQFLLEREINGDDGLELWAKGCDIASVVIRHLEEGTQLTYPPIIDAEKKDSGLIIPADIPLNRGLFFSFGVDLELVRDNPVGFTIEPLNISVGLEPIAEQDVLTSLTPHELAGLKRVPANPVLRAVLL